MSSKQPINLKDYFCKKTKVLSNQQSEGTEHFAQAAPGSSTSASSEVVNRSIDIDTDGEIIDELLSHIIVTMLNLQEWIESRFHE